MNKFIQITILNLLFSFFLACSTVDKKNSYPLESNGSETTKQMADKLARETASWFQYTTGPMDSEHLGQCADYAVMFILKYNKFAGKNIARLIVANNPIPNGTYRVEEKIDVSKLGVRGFPNKVSGFLSWNGQLYVYHPALGAYPIFLEKVWTPKTHFGINMLDKNQIHVWVSVEDVSVDPTYFDLWPQKFISPLGEDE